MNKKDEAILRCFDEIHTSLEFAGLPCNGLWNAIMELEKEIKKEDKKTIKDLQI